MAHRSFFDESREQSQVKTAIVAKYFDAWSRVMLSAQKKYPERSSGKIAYVDLFAGPGRYKDGTKSAPLLVLEKAIASPELRQTLVTQFNDGDKENASSLEAAIRSLPGVDALKYAPRVSCHEVGGEIVKQFEQMRLIPTLFFVDPWGYKGLSLRLVNSVLKDWGCDCIVFFNYNRVNMGLSNPLVKSHMDALFGSQRAARLRERLESLPPESRQLEIVEEICEALKEMGGTYTLPFQFMDSRGTRTSHHLIFVSKHFLGYDIMKTIMAGESTCALQGVSTFTYSPADRRQPVLFELTRPLDDLADLLLNDLAGRTMSVQDIYETHSVGRPYLRKHYNAVLKDLEAAGRVTAGAHRRGSIGDRVLVSFPDRRG
jgi:three-Cys-motif partner protein